MKIQPQSVAGTDMACAAKKNHVCRSTSFVALFAIWMLASTLSLSAQTYSEFSLSEYVHAVETPAAMLMAGDTATFEVLLGDEDAAAALVMGIRLDLDLSEMATIPADIALSMAGSWCFDLANVFADVKPQDAPPFVSILVRSADSSSTTGAGFIFQFQLVAAQDSVLSTDLIATIDGVVIVENIDCKMAQYPRNAASTKESAAENAPQAHRIQAHAYPNPTQGRVQVHLQMDAGMQAYLITPDGQVMPLPSEYGAADNAFDLSNFPAGFYQLQIRQEGKPIWQERILKQ
jgi:surface antigen